MRSRHKSFRRRRSLVSSLFVLLTISFLLWALIQIKPVDSLLWLIGNFFLLLVAYEKTRVYVDEEKIVKSRRLSGRVNEILLKDIEEICVAEPEPGSRRIDLFRIFFRKRYFPEEICIKGKIKVGERGLFFHRKKQSKTLETIRPLEILWAQKTFAFLSLVFCLVERARLLGESERSQKFADTYLLKVLEFLKRRKKVRRIRIREFAFMQFLLFLLLSVFLSLYQVSFSAYSILILLFLSMLFLFVFLSKATFACLPSVPRNYWFREIIRLGFIFFLVIYFINPYAATIPLFLLAGWGTFSSAFYDKQSYIRTLKQGLIVILLIVVSFSYLDKIRPSQKIKIQTLAWISHAPPYPGRLFTISCDEKAIAFSALDQSYNMPDHERKKADPVLDRARAFEIFITFVKKISEKERKEFGSCLVQIHLDSIPPEIEIWRDPLAREERLAPLILPLDSQDLIAIKTLVYKDNTPTTPLLYSYKDYPPKQIPWKPGYTIKGTTPVVFYPNKAISPDKKRFAVFAWDQEENSVYLSTFDVQTKNHIATKRVPLETEDRASSAVSVIEWKNGLAEMEAKYLGRRYEELNKNDHLRLSPDKNFAATLVIKETGKKFFQLWNVIQEDLLMEIPVKTKDKEEFDAFWSNEETRLAVFHDFEILLIDTARREWIRIPVPNLYLSVTNIKGIWSWYGDVFYYYQPSFFMGLFGGDLKKIVWSKR